jgi:hypothetical protein
MKSTGVVRPAARHARGHGPVYFVSGGRKPKLLPPSKQIWERKALTPVFFKKLRS